MSGSAMGGKESHLFSFIDLATQPAGVYVDDIRVDVPAIVPEVRHQLGAAHDSTGVACKVLKEGELLHGERNLPRAATRRTTARVDDEVADYELGRKYLAAPAGQRPEAGEKLAKVEWLREVIVGAGIEPSNLILDRIERRQHQNRDLASVLPNRPADLDAAAARHQDVENEGIVLIGRHELQRLRAVDSFIDCVRGFAEPARHGVAQLIVVFGDKDSHNAPLRSEAS